MAALPLARVSKGPQPLSSASESRLLEDTETAELLQRRVAIVYAVLALILTFAAGSVAFLVFWSRIAAEDLPMARRAVWSLAAIALFAAALSARCRLGRPSARELSLIDWAGIVGIGYAIIALFVSLPPRIDTIFPVVSALTYVLLARAIVVPSSGRRTFAICLAILLPAGFDAVWVRAHQSATDPSQSEYFLRAFVFSRSAAVTTFLATLASRIIFGLRKQLRQTKRVGQYILTEKIGQGGMGVVFRATHAMLRRETAVKLLAPDRMDAAALARFEREVKLTARLTHPNTVAVFDYGRTPEGTFYYAMEYLDGGDLEDLVNYASALPPGRAIYLLEQVCRALSEAHGCGLVHRDIKPNNILICERGGDGDVAKVVDFGLVKDIGATKDPRLTADGLTGTPLYMAPENVSAPGTTDGRGDLYSLAAVGYFLVVGEPVFPASTLIEVCSHHLHTIPVPPSQRKAGIGEDLERAILRGLAKQPAERFADAGEFRRALRACAQASEWTDSDARAWWDKHRDPFRAHRRALRQGEIGAQADWKSSTLAVDFAERS